MTPTYSGLWYYREQTGHVVLAHVEFRNAQGEWSECPVPDGFVRVSRFGGPGQDVDLIRFHQTSDGFHSYGQWLGPVPPFRPEGHSRRSEAHRLLDQLHDRGLDEAVSSLAEMVAFHAEEPKPAPPLVPVQSIRAKVGRGYTSMVPPIDWDDDEDEG